MRIVTIDLARSLAILLMVVFHFCYDLKMFGYVSWDVPDGGVWQQFRWLIVSLFFLCLGVSLSLAYSEQIHWRKFIVRTSQIAAGALVISVGSYYFIRENWIFFGVLHFLALSSVLALPFVRYPRVSALLGTLVIAVGAFQLVPTRWPFHLLFDNLPSYTNDYVAFFPWFGMVLLGVCLGYSQWLKNDPLGFIKNNKNAKYFVWPGQHSLMIYLLHQPVLVVLILLYGLL
ncbi:heparan-alpha-glucosaminide N-acetyltransferase [Agaribacter flavus]|uniref:Heparan-alpha-glucosaminide N-acetyltransferase n=1 Tax=Agaribacter flavus TaxID=1902781 RepID=A0ABV7FSU1_9ALTE